MNVILLQSGQKRVSNTHASILMVVGTRIRNVIKTRLIAAFETHLLTFLCSLVAATLNTATWVPKPVPICNKITPPLKKPPKSTLVGLLKLYTSNDVIRSECVGFLLGSNNVSRPTWRWPWTVTPVFQLANNSTRSTSTDPNTWDAIQKTYTAFTGVEMFVRFCPLIGECGWPTRSERWVKCTVHPCTGTEALYRP